jgi:hypothetical protein
VRAVGYARVSTQEQGRSGVSLEAQEQAIRGEVERRGWDLVRVEHDLVSGKTMNGREGLARALAMVENGEADALVVSRLDRLTRSLLDFASLVERAQRERWRLVVVEQAFDLGTSAQGWSELLAHVCPCGVRKGERERRDSSPRTTPDRDPRLCGALRNVGRHVVRAPAARYDDLRLDLSCRGK